MNILVLIPARMGSSRFPGKPLASLLGRPMIGHVYERATKSPLSCLTAVATCDLEIFNYIKSIGGVVVMTGSQHERASDRCAEALIKLEQMNRVSYDIVVMVQGDEPMIHPNMITESVQPLLKDEAVQVVNLLGKIRDITEFEDQNCIKVVHDLKLNALYFSREPIPTRSKIKNFPMEKQVCVISFRRNFLIQYTQMEPTPLELVESVDMMRILEHGFKVRMVPTGYDSHAVDTPDDLKKVEQLMLMREF